MFIHNAAAYRARTISFGSRFFPPGRTTCAEGEERLIDRGFRTESNCFAGRFNCFPAADLKFSSIDSIRLNDSLALHFPSPKFLFAARKRKKE